MLSNSQKFCKLLTFEQNPLIVLIANVKKRCQGLNVHGISLSRASSLPGAQDHSHTHSGLPLWLERHQISHSGLDFYRTASGPAKSTLSAQ